MILLRMPILAWLRFVPVFVLMLLIACSGGGGGGDTESLSSVLSLAAPSERADGSPLLPTEIAGYRIYYGTKPGVYTDKILIEDGSVDESQLLSIPSGKYFVVVTTLDTDGRESTYSLEEKIAL